MFIKFPFIPDFNFPILLPLYWLGWLIFYIFYIPIYLILLLFYPFDGEKKIWRIFLHKNKRIIPKNEKRRKKTK